MNNQDENGKLYKAERLSKLNEKISLLNVRNYLLISYRILLVLIQIQLRNIIQLIVK